MKKWSIIKGILSLIIAAVITALTAIIPTRLQWEKQFTPIMLQ